MNKRRIEIFNAGCYLCEHAVQQIKAQECPYWEITVYDLNKKCETKKCETKAEEYEIETVPAVAINDELADCCRNRGINFDTLKKCRSWEIVTIVDYRIKKDIMRMG